MKKLIYFSFFCFLFSLSLSAQTINNVPLDQLDSEFVTIIHYKGGRHYLGTVIVEFGDGSYLANSHRKFDDMAELRDEKGEIIELNSATHALNLLYKNGYDLIDFRVTPFGESGLNYYYLLGKKEEVKK